MSRLLKCCGFRELSSLSDLQGLSVDFVGFILAPSKRQVSLEQLQELLPHVPHGIKKVGVFIQPDVEQLERVFQVAPLDVIQLHGDEEPAFCRYIKDTWGVEVIKAFHVGKEGSVSLPSQEYGSVIDYLLLDTFDPQAAGGTGKSFNWGIIPAYQEWCSEHHVKLLVAGGITVENVDGLLSQCQIDGIDVASGVETNGIKDVNKVKEMAERVKRNVRCTK